MTITEMIRQVKQEASYTNASCRGATVRNGELAAHGVPARSRRGKKTVRVTWSYRGKTISKARATEILASRSNPGFPGASYDTWLQSEGSPSVEFEDRSPPTGAVIVLGDQIVGEVDWRPGTDPALINRTLAKWRASGVDYRLRWTDSWSENPINWPMVGASVAGGAAGAIGANLADRALDRFFGAGKKRKKSNPAKRKKRGDLDPFRAHGASVQPARDHEYSGDWDVKFPRRKVVKLAYKLDVGDHWTAPVKDWMYHADDSWIDLGRGTIRDAVKEIKARLTKKPARSNPKVVVLNPTDEPRSLAECVETIHSDFRRVMGRSPNAKEKRALRAGAKKHKQFHGVWPAANGQKVKVPAGTGSVVVGVGEIDKMDYVVGGNFPGSARKGRWTHKAGDHGRTGKKTRPAFFAFDPSVRNAVPLVVQPRGSKVAVKASRGLVG